MWVKWVAKKNDREGFINLDLVENFYISVNKSGEGSVEFYFSAGDYSVVQKECTSGSWVSLLGALRQMC